jgi:hypothetical protein
MIVIEKQYIPGFNIEKAKIQDQLDANFIDIVPVEILNDNFILPELVLVDDIFKQIFVNFKDYVTREVAQDEFFKTEINETKKG